MRFYEPGGKKIIVFAVLGIVGLLVVGSLGQGSSSYLYFLNNANSSSSAVTTMFGTVVPILFLVALVLKLI